MDVAPEHLSNKGGAVKREGSSDSDSSSTGEDERLRRLFDSCDADGDGYLDGDDFLYMCKRLNMEDSAAEIMQQLGVVTGSRISFNDFIQSRSQILADSDHGQYLDDTGIESETSGINKPNQANITSWPTMSSDSFGALSGKPDSLDYDSGARDMSPEPPSLQALMESHDPNMIQQAQEDSSTNDMIQLANRLHLAAITSLKGEVIELNNRLQFLATEKDGLEKQLNRASTDRLHLQREFEDRLEQTTGRYEERITELHSVIAELRKKIERHHINVIKEEEEDVEESDAAVHSTKSNNGGSTRDNIAGESQTSLVDVGTDLNSELSRVVTELESAIDERKRIASVVVEENEDVIEEDGNGQLEDDSVEEKALEACKQMEAFDFEPTPPPSPPHKGLRPATFHPPPPPPPNEFPEPAYLQEEINSLRAETCTLQEQIGRQEAELNMYKAALDSIREERDRFKRKVREMQTRQQIYELSSSPQQSRTGTPTKTPHLNTSNAGDRSNDSSTASEQFPVAKVAERKKLKTCTSERQILGPEISSVGLPNTKVAEHLVQSLQECSSVQEIIQTLYKCGNDSQLSEFEIEFERLQSKIDNLKSQNDLLVLTLEESKALTDRLSVLIGKYESNHTAMQLALGYSDQCLETYDVLLALVESEQAVILSNCQAAGLGALVGETNQRDEITTAIQRARHSRKTAENVAQHLLQKLDRNIGSVAHGNPWEEMTAQSTQSCKGGAGVESEFSKSEENRLREYIKHLKSDRSAVKTTVMELESIHVDPVVQEPRRSAESQRLDLENAVLMQELMAMKEEKAELRTHNYLLEKEKRAMELKLASKESEEQAHMLQIDHLKSELMEQQGIKPAQDDSETSPMSLSDYRSHDAADLGHDLIEALKREKKLKARVQELVLTLEKLSRNSEIRHQQSAEFVNDLKRANSALISAFDKSKKKYQSKMKRLEIQTAALTERYETQIQILKQKMQELQDTEISMTQHRPLPVPNETSL